VEKHETTQLLSIASQFDGRQVDALTVEAWHGVIGDLEYERALQALYAHYRKEKRWIMPAQIVGAVHSMLTHERWARQAAEEQALVERQRAELDGLTEAERWSRGHEHMRERHALQRRHAKENDVLGILGGGERGGDWMNPEVE
jgi:hypothetical protein